MENYSLFMGAAVMKMAVEMAAVSMEKPSGALPRPQFCDDLRSEAMSRVHIMEKKARSYSYRTEPYIPEPYEPMEKDEYVPAEVFPEPRGQVSMIHKTNFSKREIKKFSREVKYAEVAMVDTPEFIDWSEQSISFDRSDHPKVVPRPSHAALVLEAQIGGYNMSKVFMDGGSGLNLLFANTMKAMGLTVDMLRESDTGFHGIIPTRPAYSLGKTSLDVVFGTPTNFRREKIKFEVVDWESQYHAILGRPAFAKHREFQKIASKFGAKEELNAIDAAVDHTQPPADNRNEGALIEFLRERWEIFAWEPSDMPGIPRELAEHALNVDPTAKPVQQSMRRFSEPKRRAIGEEINRLRKAGFIRELKESEWVANPVMVPKKDTTALRMCIDYTGLNKHCPKDHFPLPRIDQIVDSTAGCDRLSFLDAYSGYNQIKLKKEYQELTAFITPHGVFCYNAMTFGLKNAGATYQRCMQACLGEQIGRNIEVYIDDIVVKTKHTATLVDDLRETFDNLDRGIEANPLKIKAILDMEPPKNLHQVQQLAGRLAALSRFIAKLGEKALPFYNLMKKSEKFEWTKEAQESFDNLKKILSTSPVLVTPREKETLLIYIAATAQVFSSVLVVEREEAGRVHGVQRPVYYLSEVLTPARQRYPHHQKLAYAVWRSARKLRHYFTEHPIVVVSEAPLKNIMTNPEATGRVPQWAIEIAPHDITYVNRTAIKSQILPDFVADWIQSQTPVAPDMSGSWIMYFDGSKRSTGAAAGVVLISPQGDKMKYILRMNFPLPTNNEAEYEALLHGMKMAKACGATRLEIYGDSNLVVQQSMNLCDAVSDNMIAYRQLYQNMEAKFEGCELKHIGRASNEEADTLANIGSMCSPIPDGVFYEVERINGLIGDGLKKCLTGAEGAWVEELPSVLWSLRTTPNRSTQYTPFFLVHGAEAVLPADVRFEAPRVTAYTEPSSNIALQDAVDLLDEARDIALARTTVYQQALRNYHSRRIRNRCFNVGDMMTREPGGRRGDPRWAHHRPARPMAGRATLWCGGPTAPFASFSSRTPSSRKPKPRGNLTKSYSRLCGAEDTERKELSGGQEWGNSLPEGEIDAIAIVIELDIISIIIIIISTIYTAITTAASRHRCNNLGISMNEVRNKLFTISLSGKAAHWYKLLKNGDSIDWEDIVPLFYSKFYPPSEIHKDRNRIYNFWPHDGESIAQAWGRLKSLMLKCPIHELPGNVIIDNFYARLSFQDKTLLDTSCSGSFTRNKEEFKRDLLDRIQENTEGWENDKDRESGIIYDYKCIEAFMDTDKFRNMSATYGLDSQVVANLYKAFASHYELPKKNFDKYHEPYKDKVDSSVNKCVVIETVDNVIPEVYIEKTPFPAKMKEYSVISSAVNKSEKKPKEPEEQIKIEPAVAIVKDLVTENVEDGHIIFCEDASNICDIPYELYTEIMHEIDSCELEDIDVVIQLANRETISPIGIVRDVEVLCDCKKEKILTRFAGEPYEFNFSKFTKTPYKADLPSNDFKMEQCASIVLVPNNPLQQHLENSESEAFRKERDELEEIFLRQPILKHDLPVEDLGTTPPPKEDPVFDLKPLPDNLKYAHIDDKKIYPVIISSKLSEIEEERLLEILKKHRGAIGYTLDDLKGISPSICQHAINMEDDAKPVVEHQRRLIPKMKEVVRNEVLKLLEAGIIYPIADSRWVSPVHCVPKKGGMTVVPNDNDELIPQRIVVGYRMCIDFRKVNKVTKKDHYPLPFIDQMLERLSKNTHF
ncbi:hypothetical protein QYE76_019697 [Lolium multiflorum]|uniref:RNase H type-1 domain-containing protein n=1 Tax=Lolium multiflorum TaxID=4521 RepID=A0AAD8VR79_LOLMU|nr:hypothetical protein QYE76_019697 [Lolium multiflorum]